MKRYNGFDLDGQLCGSWQLHYRGQTVRELAKIIVNYRKAHGGVIPAMLIAADGRGESAYWVTGA